jgi:hypothetical protein
MDVATLALLLREAEEHHGAYEASAPPHHWADWYAAYIAARARGTPAAEAEAEAGRHMEHLSPGQADP